MNFILGLLNSRLLDFYYKNTTVPKANDFYIYKTMFLKPLLIRRINFSYATDMQLHNAIVNNVKKMLELQTRIKPVRHVLTSERDDLKREIDRVDSEIDELVYELYGLTTADRQLVEGNGG